MAKAIIIEGARNCGKTYLINSLGMEGNTYKFPFANYYETCFKNDFEGDFEQVNSRPELSYFSLASDIAVLDLIKNGHIQHDVILDRNFLSTIVFGLLTGRITTTQANNQLRWVIHNYGDIIELIYVESDASEDNRGKDAWDVYIKDDTERLYQWCLEELKGSELSLHFFKNSFRSEVEGLACVDKFRSWIHLLTNDLQH